MTLVHVVGVTQEIEVLGNGKVKTIMARIDTGAARSSISLEIAEEISAEPMKETVETLQAGHEPTEIQLVRIGIKIDGELFNVVASVRDRKYMPYQARVGRDILQTGKFIIMPLSDQQ